MTVSELNHTILERLIPVLGLPEATAATRIIWEDVLQYNPAQIITRGSHELEDFTVAHIDSVVNRIVEGEPIQYAIGQARFMGLDLKVTPDTLIPRPETAGLVDMITDFAGNRPDLRVLDIGTGSGCIAIALSRALHFATIDAIDISEAALQVARFNAGKLAVKVNFSKADALNMPVPSFPIYDIIVSNPPYILESERKQMDSRVKDYEPAAALFVPDDEPLQFYSSIAAYATAALKPGGALFFEINPLESENLAHMLRTQGFDQVSISRDFLGHNRYCTAIFRHK